MLACILPVGVLADTTQTFTQSGDFTTNFVSGTEYVIPAGVTMTVPADSTFYIPANSKLTVKQGATLIVNGALDIQKGAELYAEGTVINSVNVTGEGSALAELRFPAHSSYCALNDADDCQVKIYLGTEDLLGKITYSEVSSGETRAAALNSVVYIKTVITEPNAKYNQFDEKYLGVQLNGVTVNGNADDAAIHTTKLTTAGDVTLDKFDGSRKFYTDCLITLPEKEGYTTKDTAGNTSAGDPFTVKFGDQVSFEVIVDEDYNQNPYEVYVHNGVGYTNGAYEVDGQQVKDEAGLLLFISGVDPMQKDEYGYYTFTARGDSTILVVGVIANEKIEKVGNILGIIKNIFEMIKSFFQQILNIFNFGG